MARSRKVKERTPIKAEMGSWNFVKSELRNGTIHWFCVCDCEKSMRWILPCLLKPDSLCFYCSTEKKTRVYNAGKQALQGNTVVEEKPAIEKVAPEGQMSVASFNKIESRMEATVPFDSTERQWLGQIEYFLETITDIVGKLKEAQLKREMK